MYNISQDEKKLLKILEELEEDYQAGNISDEKYKYLSKQYNDRLSNITAVDRIRAMQGKKAVKKTPSKFSQRSMAERSKKEDEQLVDKYVVKSEEEKKKSKASNKKVYIGVAIVCIFVAFIAGIGFGIFNFDFQSTSPANAAVTINETAFPTITSDLTNKTTSQKNTDVTDSGNSKNTNDNEGTDSSRNNNDKTTDNSNNKPSSSSSQKT